MVINKSDIADSDYLISLIRKHQAGKHDQRSHSGGGISGTASAIGGAIYKLGDGDETAKELGVTPKVAKEELNRDVDRAIKATKQKLGQAADFVNRNKGKIAAVGAAAVGAAVLINYGRKNPEKMQRLKDKAYTMAAEGAVYGSIGLRRGANMAKNAGKTIAQAGRQAGASAGQVASKLKTSGGQVASKIKTSGGNFGRQAGSAFGQAAGKIRTAAGNAGSRLGDAAWNRAGGFDTNFNKSLVKKAEQPPVDAGVDILDDPKTMELIKSILEILQDPKMKNSVHYEQLVQLAEKLGIPTEEAPEEGQTEAEPGTEQEEEPVE